jgi:hypothetical protein
MLYLSFLVKIVERLLHGRLKLILKCSRIESDEFLVQSMNHLDQT